MQQDCQDSVVESPWASRPLTLELFQPCCGDTFEIVCDAVAHSAQLESATPGKSKVFPQQHAPFSLLFRISSLKYLPQALYHVRHAKLGLMAVFLVPVVSQDSVLRMEAVFN